MSDPHSKRHSRPWGLPPSSVDAALARTVLVSFLTVGTLWILLSDRLLHLTGLGSEALTRFQSVKGLLFVLVTGLLIAVLLRRGLKVIGERERRYRTLVDRVPIGLFRATSGGRLTDVNPALARMLSLPGPSDGRGLELRDRFSDRDEAERWLEEVGRDGGAVRLETTLVRGTEEEPIRVVITAACRPDEDGLGSSIQGSVEDLSPAFEARQALERSEARFRALVEHLPDPVLVSDRDGHVRYISSGARGLLGFDDQERLGRNAMELVHPEDADEVRSAIERLLRQPRVPLLARFRVRHRDGSWRTIEATGTNLLSDPGAGGLVISYRDVTEQQTTEEYRRLQAQLLNAVGEAVIATDLDGTITYWNRHAEHLYGWTADEAVGRSVRALTLPATSPEEADRILANPRKGESWSGEIQVVRKDGTRFLAHVTDAPVFNPDGEIVGMLGISYDLTQQRSLETQVRAAQKMEAIGRLAAGVAHDFNNLVTAIRGYADLLDETVEEGDPRSEDLREIIRAADRAAELTRQLLVFSRHQVRELGEVDVDAILSDVERMLRRLIGEEIEFVVSPAGGGALVRADGGQLEQVIVNLAVNARDAMPSGGRLEIGSSVVTLDESEATPLELSAGPYLRLRVRDSGIGMEPDVAERVFEPFFTTKEPEKGTGLGLSTVYGIIKQSGGSVRVDTEPGSGATFDILLPVVEREPRPPSPSPQPRGEAAPSARDFGASILLVEDEEPVRTLIRKVLGRAGYHILEAQNGADALRIVREHHGEIHLALLDVVMPGMNGTELGEQLRERRPGIRLLFMSGYTEDEVLQRGIRSGEAAFIGKPFRPRDLVARVRERLQDH